MSEHYYDPVEIWTYEEREGAYERIVKLELELTKCHELQDSYCDRIAELERRIEYANELLNKRDEIEDALLARVKRAEKIIEKITQWGIKSFSDIGWYRMLAEWKGNPLPMTWGDIGKLYQKETGLSWDSSSSEILYKWAKNKPDMFFEDEDGHICEKKK